MNSSYYDFLGMPTGIEGGQPQGGFEVSIASNPCNGAVRLITGSSSQSTGMATLYDTSGRVAARTVFTPGDETVLEAREAGLYLVRVEVGDQVETRSVVVLE
ncbi:T9SS type A sorting domain-containing protein [Candidatus Fermentibacteria bacterium]|nr:T9SS type A sorting domain-containing protein [Candidatus Fermentibacteria bacterium]